jgi:hypothetical protein
LVTFPKHFWPHCCETAEFTWTLWNESVEKISLKDFSLIFFTFFTRVVAYLHRYLTQKKQFHNERKWCRNLLIHQRVFIDVHNFKIWGARKPLYYISMVRNNLSWINVHFVHNTGHRFPTADGRSRTRSWPTSPRRKFQVRNAQRVTSPAGANVSILAIFADFRRKFGVFLKANVMIPFSHYLSQKRHF